MIGFGTERKRGTVKEELCVGGPKKEKEGKDQVGPLLNGFNERVSKEFVCLLGNSN